MRVFVYAVVITVVCAVGAFGQNPTTADGWNALGASQYNQKNYEAAVTSYSECIKLLNNNAAGCYQNRAYAYRALRKNELAIADAYSWSKTSTQPVAKAYMVIVEIYLGEKKWPQVISSATEAIGLFPQNPDFYYYRGAAYASVSRSAEATADATKSIALKPSAAAYLLRSQIACNNMDLIAAEADERNVRALGGKIEKGCFDSARSGPAALNAAPPVPNRPESEKMVQSTTHHLERAAMEMEKGDVSGAQASLILAMTDADKAVALDSQNAKAYQIRGTLNGINAMLPTNKNPAESRTAAIADFNRAIQIDPKYGKAYFGRAMIFEQLGEKPKAKADFQKALELDPGDKDSEMGLKGVN